MRQLRSTLLVLLAVGLLTAPAVAETFTVTLTNGNTFETRYRPQEASWDAAQVMMMTDQGNWIALPKEDIVEVVAETESKGFGKVIDTTTIDLGIAPNDQPLPDEQEAPSELDVLQQLLQRPERNYDVPQFVSPGEAGQGGLPVGYGAGIGSGGTTLVPVPFRGGGGG